MTEIDDMAPTLLLLHGLGANAGVWAGLIETLGRPGTTLAPDLGGHGSAPWGDGYTLTDLATAIAAETAAAHGSGANRPIVIVGHSLGGAVALELASGRHGLDVRAVIGLGIKTTWTDDDVAGMARVAERGVRWFDSRAEATERFARQAGLAGLIEASHPAMLRGVVQEEGRWRVAQDPATFAQQPVDMAGLLRAVGCPVVLGAGEHDEMATEAELAAFTDKPRIAVGRGHNCHVEDPDWVAELVTETDRTASAGR